MWGSSNLLQTLIKNDLVDAFWLMIYPMTLGAGKRLFASGTIPAAFKVTESTVTPTRRDCRELRARRRDQHGQLRKRIGKNPRNRRIDRALQKRGHALVSSGAKDGRQTGRDRVHVRDVNLREGRHFSAVLQFVWQSPLDPARARQVLSAD